MFDAGWLEEVQHLDASWRIFLRRKKLIGYPEIIEYLETGTLTFEQLVDEISTKTRAYAKRQITFWRMLQKKLLAADPEKKVLSTVTELNLTGVADEVYIEQLIQELEEEITMAHDSYKRLELSQQQVGAISVNSSSGCLLCFYGRLPVWENSSDELTTDSFGDRLYYAFVVEVSLFLLKTVVPSAY